MVKTKGGNTVAGMTFPCFVLALASSILFGAGLSGCAPSIIIRPPAASDIERVKDGRLAFVLFRITLSIDGKPVSPPSSGDSNNALRIYLASLDDMGAPTRVIPAAPSQSAAAEGWHYLTLPPGVYYVLVLPPGVEQNPPAVAYHAASARYGRLTQYRFDPGRGGFWSPELMAFVLAKAPPADFEELPGFWFRVPANGQIVYLGSLSVGCRSGRGVLGTLIDSCDGFEIVNDSQSAKRAVANALPELAVEHVPLVPYDRPRSGTRVSEWGAMSVEARMPSKIETAFTGAELAPWGVIPSTGQPRSIAVYNLMAIGLELVTRASADRQAESRRAEVQPCIDRLSGLAGAIDYASRLIPVLEQAARSHGIALELVSGHRIADAADGRIVRHRMTTSVPIIRLRESGYSNGLALEFALEVRIETVDDRDVRYYSMLYSAPELPIQSPLAPRSPLYARFVPKRSMPRSIAEWCGPGGAALLEEEISVALAHIASQIVQDLDVNSEPVGGSKIGVSR